MLATGLARDVMIQEAFYDGVLWVTLGVKPNLVQVITDLIYALTDRRGAYTEVNTAAHRLKEVLQYRRCLLIVDDVWQQVHLQPLLDGAPATTRLVITRRDDILPKGVVKVVVDAMTAPEAVALLAYDLPDIHPAERTELAKLATGRLGEWPILLSLVNGFLRARVDHGETLARAIARVTERLDIWGLDAFNREIESERASAVRKTVGVSLELLGELDTDGRPEGFDAKRYHELAVFPEDAEVPIATISRLWRRVAGVARASS